MRDKPLFLNGKRIGKEQKQINEYMEEYKMPEIPTSDLEGNWLSAKDYEIGDKVSITIMSPHRLEKSAKFTGNVYVVDIETKDKKKKMWTIFRNNLKSLSEKLGTNSDKWVGMTITLLVQKNDKGVKVFTLI